MDDDIYICNEWTYQEIKEDKGKRKTLLLWSDVPTWIVVDDELLSLLTKFDGRRTVRDIIDYLLSERVMTLETAQKTTEEIIAFLVDANILIKKGEEKKPAEGDYRIRNIIVHPTNRCNLNCIMCCNKENKVRKEDEISLDVIKRFLTEARPFTTDAPTLSIIGGEPLLEKEKVLAIAEHARSLGFNLIGISTNGTLVTREFARKAKKLDMEIQVSIDGVTEEENDYLRGEGTFKKIIRGIKTLKSEDVQIVTNYLVHRGNIRSLERYLDLASNLGVYCARFGPVKRIGGGLNMEIETVPVDELLTEAYRIYISRPDLRQLFGKDYFSAFANSCRLKVKYQYCGTGLQTLLLNPDGNIYPCTGHALPEFKAGNILSSSFSEIWTSSPVLKMIRERYPVDCINEKCKSCLVRHWCMGGCRAEAYHCTRRMDSPAIGCENIKKAVIEMIWRMAEIPELGRGKEFVFE